MSHPKKLLFFPMALKGHICHTVRIAEWFLKKPLEYEVHVSCSPDAQVSLPQGVIFHTNTELPDGDVSARLFSAMSEGRTQIEAAGLMFEKADLQGHADGVKVAVRQIQELKPDMVIYEVGLNFSNVMHTAAKHFGVPDVMLVPMARPETVLSAFTLISCLIMYPTPTMRLLKALKNVPDQFEPLIGTKLIPERCKPFTIYPGAQILCEVPPKSHEMYTGSMQPFDGQVPFEQSQPLQSDSSRISELSEAVPRLRDWVKYKLDAGIPLIYIALGTLATPSAELVKRIVEALDMGPWAIIWSLPEAHQVLLPHKLSDQWLIDSFFPQMALFQAQVVDCFMSHCGGNSTTEAISNGIPIVCLPFFGDQFEWANSITVHIKAGVTIDKHKSTSADITRAVKNVLGSAIYREKAKAAAQTIMEDAQMRLNYLGAELDRNPKRVGVLVAAAVIEKRMASEDPYDVLPVNLRHKEDMWWGCFSFLLKSFWKKPQTRPEA